MLERLNEAMEHIEGCLDQRIEAAELAARIAMTSEYHFRRMFSALAGMPLSEYIRRRRRVHEGVNPAIAEFVRGIDQETMRRVASLSDQEPEGIVAVSDNLDESRAEGTELDYYHAVVTGVAVPEGLDALVVPAGTWAVFGNSGPFPQALQYLWRDVFTQWFPSNPYRSRPGPEILRARLSQDGGEAEAELWIPVERTKA
ncbi:GyrI-like domain-containing protein [Streptomyces sp. NPDC014724]|uniref:GyrI-like domain-containing protein n=1 Tax=unclassified Streptomyces TaxID=2593676 RepID=UPI0036FD3C0B